MSDVKVTIPRANYNPNQRTNIDVEVVNPDGTISTKTVKGAVQSTTQEDGSVSFGILASAHVPFTSAWTPADEGGLLCWYRAEDLALSDGNNVTTWADQSGNGRNLARYWGTSYPVFKTGITPSGHEVVRFTANAALASVPFAMDGTSSMFFFGTAPSQADRVALTHGEVTGPGYSLYHESTSAFRGVFGGVAYVGTVTPSSSFKSYGLLLDSAASNKGTFLVNNVSAGTTTSSFTTSSSYGICVGGNASDASTRYATTDMCEVVYFDHVLDATARSNLQTYFENKYL